MGDFILDLRPRSERAAFGKAAEFLRFQSHVTLECLENESFSLALASVDNPELWGTSDSGGIFTALCGRIDLEERDWKQAESTAGPGSLACKHITSQYLAHGVPALELLSGNYAVILWDRSMNSLYLVGDICGSFPLIHDTALRAFSSHPDALARCLEIENIWDETSLAEFLFTSTVTPPHTYYRSLRSLPHGSIVCIDLKNRAVATDTYFRFEYAGSPVISESDLADELSNSFSNAIRRRTLPRLGPIAVALSGGLDSRTVLAAIPDRTHTFAFCCFDQENFEFQTARAIARALDVKLVPLSRNFDYYADNAALGVQISGGMGSFANNHFLGMSGFLRELGAQNLLTGCYCDYLFKALPLNTAFAGILRKQHLAPYADRFYFGHHRMDLPAAQAVLKRLHDRIPEALRDSRDPASLFQLEVLRTFPLYQEGDNAQRLIPQRVLFSYLPVADRAVLETYCKIPYTSKLNRSLFKKVVSRICGPRVTAIADANTGTPANASLWHEAFTSAAGKVKSRMQPRSIASDKSWPDWEYYVPNSKKLSDLWEVPCPAATDFFRRVLPASDLRPKPADYAGRDLFLFVKMLTLKLWFAQRC